MSNARTTRRRTTPLEIELPRELVDNARRLANERGCQLGDLLAHCCAIGLKLEESAVVREGLEQRPDLLTGLLAVLSDPAGADGLERIKQQNPIRISLDPDDPTTAVRTGIDGSAVKGLLTTDGKFVPRGQP
ncbi:hypothetical protein [Acidovorax sp. Leaf78]|uniref:hypothetical protein n=1 Tax=Acidovorax sp. Leaf78 TaxID=1736237 RepID=UPI0007018A0A|nr:hypothetical protein [Acidovorax sp. Leaf78]KQO27196.1 hypothetical protein ASF16_19525 [Acidovorax sp. Leaf78]